MAIKRKQNPALPAFILAAFLGLFVFLLVTHKSDNPPSQQQTVTQTKGQ